MGVRRFLANLPEDGDLMLGAPGAENAPRMIGDGLFLESDFGAGKYANRDIDIVGGTEAGGAGSEISGFELVANFRWARSD